MNFNLKDVVCIDLTKYTDKQLLAIEDQEGYPNLSFYKKEGCLKVFIETFPATFGLFGRDAKRMRFPKRFIIIFPRNS